MHKETKYSLNVESSNPKSHHTSNLTYPTKSKHTISHSKEQDPLRKHTRSEYKDRAVGGTRANSVEILVTRPSEKQSSLPRHERKAASPIKLPYDTQRYDRKIDLPIEDDNRQFRSTLPLDCWHFFMIFANIIMLVGGTTVFFSGAWMIFDNTFTSKYIGANLYLITVYVLLGCGFFFGIIAVIGCIGAVKSAKCLILMYIIITMAIIMTMVTGALMMLLCRKWVNKLTEEHMLRFMNSYLVNSVIRDAWDTTQQYLHCCGVHSSVDWPEGKIPVSCCNDNHCLHKEDVYQAGCLEETETYFNHHIVIIAAAFTGVQLIILFGLIASCGYYRALTRYRL